MHNLYIHVPFCASKCNYCAFYSTACRPDWDGYANAVIRDIEYWATTPDFQRQQVAGKSDPSRKGMSPIFVPTIFFGGGTPSIMPVDIFKKIMAATRIRFDVAPNAEITLESNPGTLDASRLREFMAAGVNRLSIGVQSLDDGILKFLGRAHSAADARKLVRAAGDLGLRTSCDFIYGLPGQTVADVRKMCRDILDLGISHASLYELSIEPGTPFAAQKIKVPSNETCAEMYHAIREELAPGLHRYEVSNYAAPGEECRHNQNIWAGEPYIGIGPAAAGRVLMDGKWYETINDKNDGLKTEIMDNRDRAVEKIITGLRTAAGVKLTDDVRKVIDWDFINGNPGYFLINEDTLCVAPDKLIFLDGLLIKIIS